MPAQRRSYSLPGNLEALVKSAIGTSQLKDLAETSGPRINRDLRNQAMDGYAPLLAAGLTTVDPRALRFADRDQFEDLVVNGEGEVYVNLNSRVDDATYSAAKAGFLNPLDEPHKLGYYVSVLEQLDDRLLPPAPAANAKQKVKDAHAALKKAKQEVDLAKEIEVAALSGDTEKAGALVQSNLNAYAQDVMTVYRGMAAPIMRTVERDTYLRIAAARKNAAAMLIKEHKLYGEIDGSVGRHPEGKARSLVGMYKAYKQQEADNARQAQQARRS